MAALVSHAMRRFPSTPPDTSHSSYKLSKLRGESSRQESGESALSRSMRYADPWLYGSVPPTSGGLLLAPALVLCACHDYINGTAKSRSEKGKKSPTTCKKCKGTRLPLSTLESSYKFGTVRCYPTAALHQSSNTPRAGTVRVTSTTSRPSILPTTPPQDPYDVMRRSRLSGTQERARSISPKNKLKTESKTFIATKLKGNRPESYNSTFGRKSILECDINPYELVSSDDFKAKEQDITLVNGQRIRVRSSLTDKEYEDIQIRQVTPTRTAPPTPKEKSLAFTFSDVTTTKSKRTPKIKSPLPSPKLSDNDLNGRFKSILKKPSTFGDSDSSSNVDRTPSPLRKTGSQKNSQFYLPTPLVVPRKKVQFLMVKDQEGENETNPTLEEDIQVAETNEIIYEPTNITKSPPHQEPEIKPKEQKHGTFSDESEEPFTKPRSDFSKSEVALRKVCLIKRSLSDTVMMEQKKIQFNDTMALRNQRRQPICNTNFNAPRNNEEGSSENNIEEVNESKNETNMEYETTKPDLSNPRVINSKNECIVEKSPELEKEFTENTPLAKPSDRRIIEDVSKNDHTPKTFQDFENSKETTNEVTNSQEITKDEFVKPSEEEMVKKLEKCLAKEIYGNFEPLSAPITISESPPPSVPPRKRSNNKQPQLKIPSPPSINKIRVESYSPESPNATIVQVNSAPVSPLSPSIHKIQIKNEYTDSTSIENQNVLENPQRKTSILINGDDCYSTVNVSNNVPLYQSSVVVNDTSSEHSPRKSKKNSSTVYITGTFISSDSSPTESAHDTNGTSVNRNIFNITTFDITTTANENNTDNTDDKIQSEQHNSVGNLENNFKNLSTSETEGDRYNETLVTDKEQSQLITDLLRDPVEAVRHNLVPHVCGKSDVSRRPRDRKVHCKIVPNINRREPLVAPPLEEENITQNSLEESFLRLRNYEAVCEDGSSEHSSSTQYELMDGSECYTDHSNRSSLTEEEMANRTKFYEMLADSAIIELSETEDHQYESIKMNNDPIYEEIEIPPPLPSNPPPPMVIDDLNLDKEFTTRSIFEGASKYDILSYLVDAKERGIVQEDNYNDNYNNTNATVEEETKETYKKISELTNVSDSYEDNSLTANPLIDETTFQKTAEVERNDSGVGSETSKSSLSKYRIKPEISILCEDCEAVLENKVENEPLLCRKCLKKRSERKEIITEIVETEEKYSRDLQIILEEFYQPMLVAGLLTPEQLSAIFLNAEELLENSQALAERLRDAVEIAQEQGDDDLLTVNIGKLFLESTPMLHAFETYCVRQGAASLLLASLEKEKELLRIFLKVSQMENTMLRRMNLNSFLMVPVQRVTKYPLLLSRLYKVTPGHHDYRDELKDAQHKIELHLNHMNSETKDVPSKLWRRIGSSSGRRSSAEMDLVNIKLRKIAVDVLEWNHEEAKFVLEGKLLFTQPTDNNWRKGRTIKLTPINALLVINGKPSSNKADRTDENGLIFAKPGTKEAALLLVRDKNGRYSLLREPLYLDRCIIAADPAWQSYFEVQELMGKDTFIFKAECEELTQTWYKQLQYHAQGMGSWRKRRNALANIMINGMGLRS